MKIKKITILEKEKILQRFPDFNLKKNNNHKFWFLKKPGLSVHIYENNNMMAQGDEIEVENFFGMFWNEPRKQKDLVIGDYYGGDESGVGDLFGPIILTIFLINAESKLILEGLKIKDSKKMSAWEIEKSARVLIKMKKFYHVKIIDNFSFNENKSMNLKEIICDGYIQLSDQIKGAKKLLIIDGFLLPSTYEKYLKKWNWHPKHKVKLVTKAENKYIGVAAASIISRYLFVKEIEKIGEQIGFKIQLGANSVAKTQAKKIIKDLGAEEAKNFIKAKYNLD